MGLLSTLKTVRTSVAKLGNLAVQPTTNSVSFNPQIESTISTSTSTRGVVPAAESSINGLVGLSLDDDQISRHVNPSLSSLVNNITTNERFVLPSLRSSVNKVELTYLSHLKPRVVHRPESSDDFASTTREFEPYERLSGISHERPEIIMMVPFAPLFLEEIGNSKPSNVDIFEGSGINPYLTDAGWYVDTQLHIRNLRAVNVVQDLRELKKKNSSIRKKFQDRKRDFEKNLDQLEDVAQFLLDIVKKTDILKNQLDLRDDIFTVIPSEIARAFALLFPSTKTSILTNALIDFAKKYLTPSYTVPDALSRLGYPSSYTKTYYSSTKIWLQLLLEYKHILMNHSLEFLDVEPTTQRNDKNASTITRSDAKLFGLATADPDGIGAVSELVKAQPVELRVVLGSINKAFQTIYDRGAKFKSEEAKIAGLSNLLSKEHKFSRGLTDQTVRRALFDYYGYSAPETQLGNLQMFDFIVGRFGHNVFEFPAVDRNSLASISQQQPAANVAVLTFESKYLDGDDGTLTPGSSFYVDSIFRTNGQNFDTDGLKDLSKLLKTSYRNFSVVVNGLNVLSTIDSDPQSSNKNNISTYLDSPSELISYILRSVLDKNGSTLPSVRNDRLASIYALAARDVSLKSILFHYTLNRMFRTNFISHIIPNSSSDNTPTTDALITRLLSTLLTSTKESRSSLQLLRSQGILVDANDLDDDSIKTALKQGTVMTSTIENIMLQIYNAIQQSTFNNRMRYSGQYNTVIMMIAFDILISIIAKYANQQLVSRRSGGRSGNRKTTYVVAKTNVNHKNSKNDITTRLNRELALTQQLTYTILNALQKLSSSVDGFINYLSSPAALLNLRAINRVIPDTNILQMLLSEQQVMLFGSTVFDMASRYKKAMTANPNTDIDGDGDFDSDDEIKLLDDSLVSSKLRSALFGTLSTSEFVGTRAYNKKILTVGIPLGFTRRLKQQVGRSELKKTSFTQKQHDIVQVVVYKVDLVNQDIIYRPRRFLFEMSRFPVRDDSFILPIKSNPTISDIADSVPTRDWEESFEDGKLSISYWSSKLQGLKNTTAAMDAESYSFMSVEQKAEVIKNHIVSYMLELYLKLTAGINVGEYAFDLIEKPRAVESEFIKLITEHKLQDVADFARFTAQQQPKLRNQSPESDNFDATNFEVPTGGVMFTTTSRQKLPAINSSVRHITQTQPRTTSASGVPGTVDASILARSIENPPEKAPMRSQARPSSNSSTSLNSLGHRQVPQAVHTLKSVSAFSRMQTSLADGLSVSKQVMMPKQFDRVFNVIVDPDEFEIDFAKTTATIFGTQALRQMIRRGDIVPASTKLSERSIKLNLPLRSQLTNVLSRPTYKGRPDPNINNFKFRDRDRKEGDLTFEKYFITIETFGEEDV